MTKNTASEDTGPGRKNADSPHQELARKAWSLVRPWRGLTLVCLVAFALAARAWLMPKDYQSALLNGDYLAAERMLLVKAEAGDMNAQNALGNLYYLGLGPERDFGKAAKWYLKAALAGNGNAQINISHLYRQGLGVPDDKLRSLAWLTHARSGNYEAAEKHMKWHSVRLQMSVSQRTYAREKYPTVRSLDPDIEPAAK